MKFKNKLAAMLVASGSLAAASSAHAAAYAAGDLVLYFFQEGGSQTVYANLGAATGFRGSVAGPSDVVSNLNVKSWGSNVGEANESSSLGNTLTTAFGENWASLTNLYSGLIAVNNAFTSTTTAAVNGDPNRTIYFSAPNNLAEEALGRTIEGNSAMTILATQIAAQGSGFTGTDDFLISPTGVSNQIMSQNPFLTSGILGVAFDGFDGGIAQVGIDGTYGSLGGVSNVEFALDLHRMLATTQAANTINGVDADGNAIAARTSMYEGTITINSNGVVGFQAVPEPSSVMLLGLGAGALAFRRRRSA
jgi:hypothetical protein